MMRARFLSLVCFVGLLIAGVAMADTQDAAWQSGENFGKASSNQIQQTVKSGNPVVPGQNPSYQAPSASGNLDDEGKAAMLSQPDGQFLSQNMNQNPRATIDVSNNTAVINANNAQNKGDNLPANQQPYCFNNTRPDGGDCTSTTYQSFPQSPGQIPRNMTGDPEDSYNRTDNFENQASAIDGLSEANPMSPNILLREVRTFTGNDWQCRDIILNFDNCCKDSGWGQSIGIAGCNAEEQQLGQAKEKKFCHYVGEYCADHEKIAGICLNHKKTYCCFDSMLSRIIQEQGRAQINKPFGKPDNADCSGFSARELSRIDFSRIDFSEYYQSLEAKVVTPNQNDIERMLNHDVGQQLPGGGS